MKSSGVAREHFSLYGSSLPGWRMERCRQWSPSTSVWAVRQGLLGLTLGLAWGWVSAWARKMPASTSIVWPIAPPRQLPFVPSWNRFYKTRLIALDDCCHVPNSWMLQRCVMAYRRVEKTWGGSEQLLSVGVLQAVRGFFPLDWRETILELGKSRSVAPSAGSSPGRAPHAGAPELESCTSRENKGQQAPGRNAESGTAVPVQAVDCLGISVGAFASHSSAVPGGEGKPAELGALPRAAGGRVVTCGWAGTLLPGGRGQDRAWNLSLALRPVPLPWASTSLCCPKELN